MAGLDLSWLQILGNQGQPPPTPAGPSWPPPTDYPTTHSDFPAALTSPAEFPLRGVDTGLPPMGGGPGASARILSPGEVGPPMPGAPSVSTPLIAGGPPPGGGPGGLGYMPGLPSAPPEPPRNESLFDSGYEAGERADAFQSLSSPDTMGPKASQNFPSSIPQRGTPAVDELGRIAGEPRDPLELKDLPSAYLNTADTIGKTLGKWDEMISPKLYRPGFLDGLFGQSGAAEAPPTKSPLEEYIASQGGPIKGDEKIKPARSKGKGGPGLTASGPPAAPVSHLSSYDAGTYTEPGLAPHRAIDEAPNFSNVMDELDQTRPHDQKQEMPRWQAGLLGLVQGLASAPHGATLGQMLLGAGAGTLGAAQDYDREGRRIDRQNQSQNSEFHRQMAESLLSQDQAKLNWKNKGQQTTFENEMADYQREQQIRQDLEPKVNVTSAGIVRQGVDPATGKRSFSVDTALADAQEARADARQYAHEDRQFARQKELLNARLAARKTASDASAGDPVLANLGIGGGKRTPETMSREFGLALARNPGLVSQVFGPKATTMGQDVNNLVGKDSSFHSMAGYMKGKTGDSQANTLAQSAVANYYADKIMQDPEAQKTVLRLMGAH